jgi:endonuclease/exonuclease/phosphatase family metal-dependent hydrolase
LTWNLYHGRSPEPAGRSLLSEFARALADWEWDVALLQEVPPWWPPELAHATGSNQRHVRTSRNFGLPVRRAVSERDPDILKANGGGANAILVRGRILDDARQRLTWWPERRYAHAALTDHGWIVNLHASTHRDEWARRDVERARRRFPDATLFGGDLNLRGRPHVDGYTWLGGNHVDHLYGHGEATYEVLERGRLSDHPPVRVTL